MLSLFLRCLSASRLVRGQTAVTTVDTNILYLYSAGSLSSLNASADCVAALASNVSYYPSLGKAVTQRTLWTETQLTSICSTDCTDSLTDYVAEVDDACGSTATYNLSATVQTASDAGRELLWKQEATCLADTSSGELCNTELQSAANSTSTSGTDLVCSQCYLDYLSTVVNSEWGQAVVAPSYFEAKVSSCSATGYSFTYTATTTAASTSSAATTTSTANARCNVTSSSSTLYTVNADDTCVGISAAKNVSTGLLASVNNLGSNCTYLTANQTLCLPSSCDIYMVQQNDTCTSVMANLTRKVPLTSFLSWNSNINSMRSNMAGLVGQYICISPLGTTTIPNSFPLQPATTAVPVPTNAVTTSNTDCGYWYTIQANDTCADVASSYGISLNDFYFLNPELNGTCASLWTGNSYCVEAVGNVATCSGYMSNATASYTSLASALETIMTRTINRTTTHFFYSWPAVITSSATYNTTAVSLVASYTLCSAALSAYNITDPADLPDAAYENDAWMSEYQRVCLVDPDSLPSSGFNTSITLTTETATGAASSAASTGASATITTASLISTSSAAATSTGLSVSPDGTCGGTTEYTCKDSQFGDCCSSYGYCGSSSDYCSTSCDSGFGDCNTSSATATSTSTSTSAATSPTSSISPDGTCGGTDGYVCSGSQFGDCCSTYGYCGSSSDYCSTYCDSSFGLCDTSSATTTTTSATASTTGTVSPDGTCGGTTGYTCAASSFGSCCSIYGYCGSTTDYCAAASCDSSFGTCES